MKKFTVILTALLIAAGLSACDTTKKQLKQMSNDKMDSTFNVKVGETVVLELSSNPSTGYKWNLVGQSNDKCVTLENREYKAKDSDPNMIGSGGTDCWTYKAKKTGEVVLWFKYERENDVVSKESYYKIVVSE